jgi:hypothetical protein
MGGPPKGTPKASGPGAIVFFAAATRCLRAEDLSYNNTPAIDI